MEIKRIEQKSVDAVNSVTLGAPIIQFLRKNSTEFINSFTESLGSEGTTEKLNCGNECLTTEPCQGIDLIRNRLVERYKIEIINIIKNDKFEDGSYSHSEAFINEQFKNQTATFIKSALNELYIDYFNDPHVLTGIMLMSGSVSYDCAVPELPTMAIGLLQHRDEDVKDRAIQAFERWNSKKSLTVLENIMFEKKWMQHYVEKVIEYIKRDGVD